ncbi:hypothetical protein AB0A98_06135 [Streptomyces chrestomyceticus]|uniref:hypothetical protein n=1 Tax=Streptomyces chrestomyceticus TaxID=68185 RepID=UPI0033E507B4
MSMHAGGGTALRRLTDKIAKSPYNPELGELTRDDWTMADLIGPTDEKVQLLGFVSPDQW